MTYGYYRYSRREDEIRKIEDLEFSSGADRVVSLNFDDGRSPGVVFMGEYVGEEDTVIVPTLGELCDGASDLINVFMIAIAHGITIKVICGIDGVGLKAQGWECLVLCKLMYIMECRGLLNYK